METMQEIVGRKITAVSINEDQRVLVFATSQGPVIYHAEGDCCSESWFADLTGVDALLGATVQSVEAIDMEGYNTDDGRCRQESDEAYGYKIKTDKGHADLVFRNSSNGYYGGWLSQLSALPVNSSMSMITADWRA